jgi:hypothetical protein
MPWFITPITLLASDGVTRGCGRRFQKIRLRAGGHGESEIVGRNLRGVVAVECVNPATRGRT